MRKRESAERLPSCHVPAGPSEVRGRGSGRAPAELCAVVPATLVTHGPDGFRASILPMLFDRRRWSARACFAATWRAGNPHWREIEASIAAGGDGAGEALAIFDGPDAYVSPAWYEEKRLTGKVVPTWNYVTVQAHGTITTRPRSGLADPARRPARRSATKPVDPTRGRSPTPPTTTSAPRPARSSASSCASPASRRRRSSARTAAPRTSRERSMD